jgi:hypothetical protein
VELSGDEKSTLISPDISPLFFHSFQTCSGTCNSTRWDFASPGGTTKTSCSQTIPGPRTTHRTPPTRGPPFDFRVFRKLKKYLQGRRFPSDGPSEPRSGNGSGAGHFVVPPGLGKSRRVLLQVPQQVWKLWKNRRLMSGDIRVLFLSPLISIHLK